MAKYNPNSIWDGKKEPKPEDFYTPSRPEPNIGMVNTRKEEPAPTIKIFPPEEDDAPPARNHALGWSIVGSLFLVGLGLAYFFFRPQSGPNVSIEFSKPNQVLTGDPFHFGISLTNYSSNVLKNANLSVFLPDNVSFVGQAAGRRVMEQVIGDLGPGSINKPEFDLIVTGDPNSVKHVTAKLTYGTDATAQTQFETDGSADVVVGGPAISLNIAPPTGVFSGQDFDTTVTYTNNTSHSFQSVKLSMRYPPVFTFTGSSVPADSAGNNSWNLGTIPPAGSASFSITGNIIGPDNGAYSFEGVLAGSMLGSTYTLTDQTANVTVGSSPLALKVMLNNMDNYVAKAGDSLNYALVYTNTSNVTFQNIAIKATLLGSMFDLSSLQSNGSFNSVNNTITWYGANAPQLLTLAAGQSGSVGFTIKTKAAYPIRLLSDKNYTLKVTGKISSSTVPPGMVASSTVSVASAENKVGGVITIQATGLWRDAASGILNAGPYPPKVNQATQYTIHWIVTNYATDADSVTVSSYLQSGTTCTGRVMSNVASSTPLCNAANGQVTWTIPRIPATTGLTGAPAEAIIQVQNTPAINQLGQALTLLGPSTLRATDGFTGVTMSANDGPVTTDLPDDATISGQNRRVTQ